MQGSRCLLSCINDTREMQFVPTGKGRFELACVLRANSINLGSATVRFKHFHWILVSHRPHFAYNYLGNLDTYNHETDKLASWNHICRPEVAFFFRLDMAIGWLRGEEEYKAEVTKSIPDG